MASTLGTVACFGNANRKTCILGHTAANSSAPSAAADGVPVYPTNALANTDDGVCYTGRASREAHVCIIPSGATPSGIYTLWGYIGAANGGAGAWVTIQKLNNGDAITTAYSELVLNLGHFDRIAVELTGLAGSTEAWVSTSLSGCE